MHFFFSSIIIFSMVLYFIGGYMKNYIKGIYKKSIFTSEKGYIIGLFKVRETNEEKMLDFINKTITFTGYFHELRENDIYIFYGEEIRHPKYGMQYQVSEYEKQKPDDKDGVIEFLSSDSFPGIGERLAGSIVEVLGDKALERIIENRSVLDLIPKLTTKKADIIYNNLIRYEESHAVIVNLTEIGFSMRDAMAIYNLYKKDSIKIIDTNIYELIDVIEEIGFSLVDEIALKNGIDIYDKERIKAGIIYVMKQLAFKDGDVYSEYSEIFKEVNTYLKIEIDSDLFDEYLFELEQIKKLIKYEEHYYLYELYMAEEYVGEKVVLLSSKDTSNYKNLLNLLDHMESFSKIKYNDKQREAIIKALENHILIITGGPGTGKTTIIKAIIELYSEISKISYEKLPTKVALLAPTGRASKRMSEATGIPAMTIHRFLKWNKETNKFAVDEYNQDDHHLIIVDEVSMIDINLLSSLFKGLTSNIKVVLVGDSNQLPSVGPGQVLKDLIDSGVIDTVELKELYRQDENSYINKLAIEIKDEELSDSFDVKKSDFTFLECTSVSIRNNLNSLAIQLINKGYDYKRVQIMAPMYSGENGIDNLNRELQQIFNKEDVNKTELSYGDVIYRENDKVLQLVNMPDENVFNGDIGIIKFIDKKTDEIQIDFDSNIVKYKRKDFNKFKHGFVISIHKSQGSEFELVVIPICNGYRRMLYKKLIYTGITRAKKKLIIIGEKHAFLTGVRNNMEYIRKTSLNEKISNFLYKK